MKNIEKLEKASTMIMNGTLIYLKFFLFTEGNSPKVAIRKTKDALSILLVRTIKEIK